MSRTIQIKRGLKADLPALAVGELGFTIDTHEVFIGSAAGNVPVESKESSELLVQLESDGAAMQSNITQLNNEVLAMSRGLGQSISSLALLNSTYPAGDTKDHIVAGNVKEVATLTVTAIPSVSANVTVTLDGTAHTLLANPLIHITTAALASAIRSQVFSGWVTGGTGNVVTFESTTVGPKGSHSFSGGTSGAAGSMVTTTEGEAANFHRYFWSGTAWLDGGVDFFTQEYKEAIEAQVLADFTAAENARQVEYDAAEAIRQSDYLQASQAAAANQELYEGLLEEGVLQTSINTKLAALELEYAPELATLQQSDVTMSQQLAQTVFMVSYPKLIDEVDDTSRLQRAFDALETKSILVLESKKIYNISNLISLDLISDITIIGNGAKIEYVGSGLKNVLKFSNGDNIHIYGIKIDGKETYVGTKNFDSTALVSFDYCNNVSLKNTELCNGNGIGVQARYCNNVVFEDNNIYNVNQHPIWTLSSNKVLINNNSLTGIGNAYGNVPIGSSENVGRGGIGYLGTKGDRILVTNNTIKNMTDTGTKTEGATNVIYDSNHVENFGKDGIKIQSYVQDNTLATTGKIINNTIKYARAWRSDGAALILADCHGIEITGNFGYGGVAPVSVVRFDGGVDPVEENFIRAKNCSDVIISDNYEVESTVTTSLYLEKNADVSVLNNRFKKDGFMREGIGLDVVLNNLFGKGFSSINNKDISISRNKLNGKVEIQPGINTKKIEICDNFITVTDMSECLYVVNYSTNIAAVLNCKIKNNTFKVTGTTGSTNLTRLSCNKVSYGLVEFEGNNVDASLIVNPTIMLLGSDSSGNGLMISKLKALENYPTFVVPNYDSVLSYIAQDVFVNDLPTGGAWKKGQNAKLYDYIPRGGVSGSKFYVNGYKRLTTGSGNVLNIDWLTDRRLTGE